MADIDFNKVGIGEDEETVTKTHVDDMFTEGEEEEIGVMGGMPIPGSTPTSFKSSQTKTSTTSNLQPDNTANSQADESTAVQSSRDDAEPSIDGPELSMDEPDFSIANPEPSIDEPAVDEVVENQSESSQPESVTDSSTPSNEQTHNDYSHIKEAQGPTFDGLDDTKEEDTDRSAETQSQEQSQQDTFNNEQTEHDTGCTIDEDDIIDSVVYEEDSEFDGEKIKNDYKNQKKVLPVKTQQLLGFAVVFALFLLIFGISKVFNALSQKSSQQYTEEFVSSETQPGVQDLWYDATENISSTYDTTQALSEFAFTAHDTTNTASSEQSTEIATTEPTTEAATPSVSEVFGITDSRFQTIDELTQYISNALTVISSKSDNTISQYQNGDISKNHYTENLNLYYKAVVELAQLLVANKQVYIDNQQEETYNSLESQIRSLADTLEIELGMSDE